MPAPDISVPEFDFSKIPSLQQSCISVSNMKNLSSLSLVFIPYNSVSLLCHVFTGVLRPLVLETQYHSVSHPGIRDFKRLISVWFLWPWKLLSMLRLKIQTEFLIFLWFCLVYAPFLKKTHESLSPRLCSVYGNALNIPGELLDSPEHPIFSFLSKMERAITGFAFPPPHHINSWPLSELLASLVNSHFVFVREDASKPCSSLLRSILEQVLQSSDRNSCWLCVRGPSQTCNIWFSRLHLRLEVVCLSALERNHQNFPPPWSFPLDWKRSLWDSYLNLIWSADAIPTEHDAAERLKKSSWKVHFQVFSKY